LKQTSGSRTYPVGYAYDDQGRMTQMTNWTTFASVGARVTTWNYSTNRGWLDSKDYPDRDTGDPGTIGLDYTYKPSGRLLTRTLARGNVNTYYYNSAGDLSYVSVSGAPDITFFYDRRGRQSTITCNGITTSLTYNNANQLLSESYSGGTLNGLTVTSGYDSLLRRNSLSLNTQPSTINHSFGYNSQSGRLESVSDGTHSATYSYLANSPLVSQITFKQNSTARMRKH